MIALIGLALASLLRARLYHSAITVCDRWRGCGGRIKKLIFATFAGNAFIAVTKFAAAATTGSSAMLSEGIHSLVDTGNQVLPLHGLRRAPKPADARHPFGDGKEVYFWTFVVAILIFAAGAVVSIVEGIDKLGDPRPVSDPHLNFIVLGIAALFEFAAWWVAFSEFRKAKVPRGFLDEVRAARTPRCSRYCSRTPPRFRD